MMTITITAIVILYSLVWSSLVGAAETFDRTVSKSLFFELEELSRLVAISYCIGHTGVQEPFECLSHCSEFKDFQLVETWSNGIIEASSAGYIVLSHAPNVPRIIAVFRGTHSFADIVKDLTTSPAEYLPYPVNDAADSCTNCTVHSGFMGAWNETKPIVMPVLQQLVKDHPSYTLVLAGHSMGGAIAALAALELQAHGVNATVTTFGEPRLGNKEMAEYMDKVFPWNVSESETKFRRVTHVDDPVPLLPFESWGWHMHGTEIYISKAGLPPSASDLERCEGPSDERCIQGASAKSAASTELLHNSQQALNLPGSWKLWQLLFAHREYFWRIGLCFDPQWNVYRLSNPEKTSL